MNTKIISIATAVLMANQNLVYALDRTDGVTDQAVAQAQGEIQTLDVQLRHLDNSLAELQAQINSYDKSGNVLNGAAITGAAIGIGLTALSTFSLVSSKDGSGAIIGVTAAIISGVVTAASAASGASSIAVKPDLNLDQTKSKISAVQEQIRQELQKSGDKSQNSKLLKVFSLNLAQAEAAIDNFQNQKDSVNQNKVLAQVSQTLGTALMIYGSTQRNGTGAMKLGVILATAGNIGSIVGGLRDDQINEIKSEIVKTRAALQASFVKVL